MKAWKSQRIQRDALAKKQKQKTGGSNEPELNDAKTNEAPCALADWLV